MHSVRYLGIAQSSIIFLDIVFCTTVRCATNFPAIQKNLEPWRPRVKLRGVVLVVPLASHVPFVHVPVVGKRQDPLFHGSELIGSGAQKRKHMAKVLMAQTRHLQGFFSAKYGPLQSIKGLRRVAPFGLTYLFRVLLREVGGCKEVCVVCVALVYPRCLTPRLVG